MLPLAALFGVAAFGPALIVNVGLMLSLLQENGFAGGQHFAYGFVCLSLVVLCVFLAVLASRPQKHPVRELLVTLGVSSVPLLGVILYASTSAAAASIIMLPIAVLTVLFAALTWSLLQLPRSISVRIAWFGLGLLGLAALGTIVTMIVF